MYNRNISGNKKFGLNSLDQKSYLENTINKKGETSKTLDSANSYYDSRSNSSNLGAVLNRVSNDSVQKIRELQKDIPNLIEVNYWSEVARYLDRSLNKRAYCNNN